jgi:hypothetical protein
MWGEGEKEGGRGRRKKKGKRAVEKKRIESLLVAVRKTEKGDRHANYSRLAGRVWLQKNPWSGR